MTYVALLRNPHHGPHLGSLRWTCGQQGVARYRAEASGAQMTTLFLLRWLGIGVMLTSERKRDHQEQGAHRLLFARLRWDGWYEEPTLQKDGTKPE